MRKIYQIIFVLLFTSTISGQSHQVDTRAKTEIKKLYFLIGHWNGAGWILGENREKHSFVQSELVAFKLDSTAILVEGLGEAQGTVIHEALAIITYDSSGGQYSFRSYLASGRQGVYPAEIIQDKFYWYPDENMRYIIYLNEDGQWYETGEMKHGGNWFQFFEMTPDKVGS